MSTEPNAGFLIAARPYLLVLVGILIGSAFTSLGFISYKLPSFSKESAQSAATYSGIVPKSDRLSVQNQKAGNTVTVESITVPPPGVWVAVHQVNISGLGNVIGAARVREPRTNVSVELLIPTEMNNQYAVVLYRDNGDDQFDRVSDSVYVDLDTGRRVEVRFSAN
jgi:hypothetical protein